MGYEDNINQEVSNEELPAADNNGYQPSRVGFDKGDKSPFYYQNPIELRKIYFNCTIPKSIKAEMLYTDVYGFKTAKTKSITQDTLTLDTNTLKVKVQPIEYDLRDSQLNEHEQYAIQCFKSLKKISKDDKGEFEDNESLRVENIDLKKNIILCRKARYFKQIATNLTLDWESGKIPNGYRTLREYSGDIKSGELAPLDNSCLANTLGVAVMLYNPEGKAFIRVRKDEKVAAITEGGLHCSASGVFEMEEKIKASNYDYSSLAMGMEMEIESELNLQKDDYDLYPVAFARELPRGGKPQLFFVAVTHLSDKEVAEKCKDAKENWEYLSENELQVLKETGKVDEKIITQSGFNTKLAQKDHAEFFTYEGWACLHLSQAFVDTNRFILRKASNKQINAS